VAQLSTLGCMKARTRNIVVLSGLALVLLAFVVPELRAAWTSKTKYRVGVSADSIEHDFGVTLHLQSSGVVSPVPMTDDDRRHSFGYSAYVPLDCVYVQFNFDREVGRVTKVTPFRLLWRMLHDDAA
jgi:hypothetical protein